MISKEDMQNFDDYSKWVEDKIITDPQDRLNENVLGLCEEANYYNANLTYVMLQNMRKLNSREDRGTLKGSGDNR